MNDSKTTNENLIMDENNEIWYKTDDIGYSLIEYDNDCEKDLTKLKLTGRLNDLIIDCKSSSWFAKVIEADIQKLLFLKYNLQGDFECALVGYPNYLNWMNNNTNDNNDDKKEDKKQVPMPGELLILFVSKGKNNKISEYQIQSVISNVDTSLVIDDIIFVDQLPKTPQYHKIDRKLLKQQLIDSKYRLPSN